MIVGPGPAAEFLAIISHGGHTAGMTPGALTKESNCLFTRAERQQIAQGLQAGKNPHGSPAIFGHVVAMQLIEFKTGGEKMHVVHQRVSNARRSQRMRQLRLPDAFGKPCAFRRPAELLAQIVAHQLNLLPLVLGRDRHQNRFVKSAAHQLDLPARSQFLKLAEKLRVALLAPFQ